MASFIPPKPKNAGLGGPDAAFLPINALEAPPPPPAPTISQQVSALEPTINSGEQANLMDIVGTLGNIFLAGAAAASGVGMPKAPTAAAKIRGGTRLPSERAAESRRTQRAREEDEMFRYRSGSRRTTQKDLRRMKEEGQFRTPSDSGQ